MPPDNSLFLFVFYFPLFNDGVIPVIPLNFTWLKLFAVFCVLNRIKRFIMEGEVCKAYDKVQDDQIAEDI